VTIKKANDKGNKGSLEENVKVDKNRCL